MTGIRALLKVAVALAAAVTMTTTAMAQTTAAPDAKPQTQTQTAIFAAGCFWCVEEAFDKVEGVVETISGYTGGTVADPTYEQVSSGGTGHTEALEVRYDPGVVSYEQLLDTFWRNVDMFDAGGQFCDRGSPYRSAIFVAGDAERRLAEASKQKIAEKFGREVVTPIQPAAPFYPAEDYHQDYHNKNPLRYNYYKWGCGRAARLEEIWKAGG